MRTYTSRDELDSVLREKHVPTIKIPAGIKANEGFELEISVGDSVAHPNTLEHHIEWIDVFAEVAGRAFNPVHLARVEFEPIVSEPKVKLKLKLGSPSRIIVQAFCNLHGLWESDSNISLNS